MSGETTSETVRKNHVCVKLLVISKTVKLVPNTGFKHQFDNDLTFHIK